ncbi:uncharacterized protein LOC119742537 [Patiria miniata]|uniref:Reverse transcriptase n=1 Tax=Patiria miniata TaxID=46514 RepID=A0A914BE23_PATMI|nr:uncharacterized protein LOC119742537 [Patiria miniata]
MYYVNYGCMMKISGILYVVLSLAIQAEVDCCYPYPLAHSATSGFKFQVLGKLKSVSVQMDVDLEQLRSVSEACGLTGQELVQFCREERREKEDTARDIRHHSLEIRRQEHENLELQLQLETLKHEPISTPQTPTSPNANTSVLGTSRSKAKTPRLPVFDETRDDLDAYIQRFERYATTQEWDEKDWAISLSALLKGKALDVYSRLAVHQSNDYKALKEALLKRFNLTAVGFRQKFRETKPEAGETAPQFMARLDNIFTRWVDMDKADKTYDGIKDLVLREQFLNRCTEELRLFLNERKPRNVQEMSRLAEQYTDAHGSFGARENIRRSTPSNFTRTSDTTPHAQSRPSQSRPQYAYKPNSDSSQREIRTCYLCHKKGHIARNCNSRPKDFTKVANIIASALTSALGPDLTTQPQSSGTIEGQVNDSQELEPSETIACILAPKPLRTCCVQGGSLHLTCGHELPLMSAACRDKNPTCMPVTECVVNGRNVSVLRDTGCSTVVIRQDLVSPNQMTGKDRTCVLVDGTIRKAPIAIVELDTPYFIGSCEALCMPNPVYDIIIGNISNARDPQEPDPNWSKPHSPCESNTELAIAVETRSQKIKAAEPMKKLKVAEQLPEIDHKQMKIAQQNDSSLNRIRELAESKDEKRTRNGSRTTFMWLDGLLHREYQSPSHKCGQALNQLIVPTEYRNHVMKVAHESILGGHQGAKKTADRVLSNFFWPGVQADVTRYCRSCDICQRTVQKGRVVKVPLGKMPIIDTPFHRVAIDIVGPIHPVSDRGNRYILTLVDYATRYPEAIPLRNIETVTVAEAMVDVFTRVGLPNEILTDQGSQFTSELMREISRLLSVRQLTTTPYHPSCNGLVERFNGVMKQMLKRLCAEKPRDWDRYLAPLLFAYRDTPHETTGFSPFELLYGRTVRGPMSILKELWTGNSVENEETRTTYQYVVDLRERLDETCKIAQEAIRKSSEKSKRYYDRKARPRNFNRDDLVLLLLPTDRNKLLLQWKGPFRVIEKIGTVDYRIDLAGKPKVFHANLLKKYISRAEVNSAITTYNSSDNMFEQVCVSVIECEQDCFENESLDDARIDNEDTLELPPMQAKESIDDVEINEELSPEQITETKRVLNNFREVLTDLPGKTNLGYHDIKVESNDPIRSKPYPLPHALVDTVNNEVENMLRMGIIELSDSPYASPIVLVKKPDGTNRFCIDFRKLNKVTVFDAEPIPNQEQIFTKLSKCHYFTKIDLTKGYWQVPLKPEVKPKTAFIAPNGLYQFIVMPFGLINAPATFSRIMRALLKDMNNVSNYIDDILLHTQSWEVHVQALNELLSRLRKSGLTARPSKCSVGMSTIAYLGHNVGRSKLTPQQNTVEKVQNAVPPVTKKQLRSFLGLSGYYRRFIPNYAAIAAPLTDKTKAKEPNKITWGESQQLAFNKLKQCLSNAPILTLPDFEKQFILRTDASDLGIGAILLQEQDGVPFPVAFASRKLLSRERAYSSIEKECLALIWGVQKYQSYLYGNHFVVETDHQPLAYIQKAKVANSRIMRWALALQPYRMTIVAIKGTDNVGADFLSRNV